jgi:Arc/MetJ family transcription regulator
VAIKKTALMLDQELVKQVQEILDTSTTTETISEALREVIRVRGRARGLERLRRREGMDLDDPEVMKGAWRYLDDHEG